MACIVGGVTTSHIPAIGNAIARKLFDDPYWKPFFDGYPPARDWLAAVKPDIAVVVYNDHGLNFFLDRMPTFAIGAAPEYPTRTRTRTRTRAGARRRSRRSAATRPSPGTGSSIWWPMSST
ncbi:hypothetical protein ACFOGJ_12050 [Marinibaculum pumilum]|uniref:Extradiol ring-cleavage dioxygenase class III enzyme subunit B domain-containing protein n=1 Tax=Marinibaculum pumilum TaxID=1766165 RepID=A0ABV7L0Q9_9PROT